MKLFYRYQIKLVLIFELGFVILLSMLGPPAFSQNPENELALSKEKRFSEELLIKTDRDLYIAGEQVWLKIYKINGLTHSPANISKVIYLELLDSYNNPVEQLKIGSDGNSSSSDFRLPDTLRTGNYILRAYTMWMKNFSKDLYSYKVISVINPFKKINSIRIPSFNSNADSVVFFPEGGHLINNIETRLGLRSFSKNKEPVMINAALIDENNDTISYVKTDRNGYGWARIKPSVDKKIFLVLLNKSNPVKKFPIPEILDNGITISLSEKNDISPSFLKITRSSDFGSAGSKLFMRVNSASLVIIEKEVNIDQGHEINLSHKDLPNGLSQISILDEQDKMLSERWIYNEIDEPLKYSIHVQNNEVHSREKLKIDISVTDNQGIPVESDISVSVVKDFTVNNTKLNKFNQRQIPEFSALPYNSDLSDINDFLIFYSPSELIFNQDNSTKTSTLSYLPELEGHIISGHIRDRKTGEPLSNENISLSFVGKTALCQFAQTNDQGDFYFVSKEKGLREIVIQPLSPNLKDYYLELNNPFATAFNKYNPGYFYIDSSKLHDINNAIISMQIKNIYEPFLKRPLVKNVSGNRYNFYGAPDNTILMSKYIELTSLKEVVKEIIPDVSTVKKNDEINFRLINKYKTEPFENNPLVLVDGVPINDLEKVININSGEIEKIDVFTTRYFISDIILDGILHFITKKGNLGVIDFDRSVFRLEYKLLQNYNEFQSPEYSSDSLKNNRIPDFRNTLYWNPDLHTDKTGKVSVEFYTSDEADNYMINVEGFSDDGNTGSARMILKVKGR